MRGNGPAAQVQVEADPRLERREQGGPVGRRLAEAAAETVQVRAGALGFVFAGQGQLRVVRGEAVETGEQVAARQVEQGAGVPAVEYPAGQRPVIVAAAAAGSLVVEQAAPAGAGAAQLEELVADRLRVFAERREGEFALPNRHQVVDPQPARADERQVNAVQGRPALAAAGAAAPAGRGAVLRRGRVA